MKKSLIISGLVIFSALMSGCDNDRSAAEIEKEIDLVVNDDNLTEDEVAEKFEELMDELEASPEIMAEKEKRAEAAKNFEWTTPSRKGPLPSIFNPKSVDQLKKEIEETRANESLTESELSEKIKILTKQLESHPDEIYKEALSGRQK